jgi:hypothetical protein
VTSPTPVGRLGLDLIFAVFLISGLLICGAVVAALLAWAGSGDPTGMSTFALATSAVLPSIVAWIASGIRAFTSPPVPDIRLGAALATVHLLLWVILIALGASGAVSRPPDWLLAGPVVGTVCYGIAVTWLALRWFLGRRRRWSGQVRT